MSKSPQLLERLATQLKNCSEELAREDASNLPPKNAKKIHATIFEAQSKIQKIMDDLDPIKHPGFMFDPSNPSVAGRVVGIMMISQPRRPLANVERFYGAGIYALYYKGNYKAYKAISNREHPIYVGKADPAKPASKTAKEQGDKLCRRLDEHRKNIIKASASLRIEDFEYRALVVQTGWQGAAENYLINLFRPIWNSEMKICYGFGKHGDSSKTRGNSRSPWDTLHYGRKWAHGDAKIKDAKSPEKIISAITKHLADFPPLSSTKEILNNFLEEMKLL